MKIAAKALSLFIAILLALNIIAISVTPGSCLEPHNANAMWVEPASVGFGPANATVGTKFNVTVTMNITQNVFTYGVGMKYDRTTLKVSKAGFTKPPTSEYMTGYATTASGPVIDTSYLQNGTILASESCSGMDFIPGPHSGTLIWIEFEFVQVPTPGQTLPFNISRYVNQGDTTVADDYLNTLTFTAHDAIYTVEGPIAPPSLSVTISPHSGLVGVNQPLPFTSNVTGGKSPYTFQWFLNNTPVSGATSDSWAFLQSTTGTSTVSLNATDSDGTTVESNTATVTVILKLLGDINGDGKVDVLDVLNASRSFGSYGPNYLYPGSPPSPGWNPNADFFGDNRVDAMDLVLVCRNFGKSINP
jgi:hypothetical protein